MAISVPKSQTVREQVSQEEWELRQDLAACYRLVAHYGWDDLIFTHISARAPGPDRHYLINPYGLLFEEVTASNLVKITAKGEVLIDETGSGFNDGGFVIHGAVHQARDDAHCIVHLHTVEGVVVSCQPEGLQPLQQGALMLTFDLSYHDYNGIAHVREREDLVEDIGLTNNVILRNHGLLTLGHTVADAFVRMYWLQRACEIQCAAQAHAGGRPLAMPDRAAQAWVESEVKRTNWFNAANLAWPGLLRKLDRLDPSYRT